MVGQSDDSFTLLSVKDVIFQHCQQDIKVLCTGHRQEDSEANLSVKKHVFVSTSV
jgi:hypothetical protein